MAAHGAAHLQAPGEVVRDLAFLTHPFAGVVGQGQEEPRACMLCSAVLLLSRGPARLQASGEEVRDLLGWMSRSPSCKGCRVGSGRICIVWSRKLLAFSSFRGSAMRWHTCRHLGRR